MNLFQFAVASVIDAHTGYASTAHNNQHRSAAVQSATAAGSQLAFGAKLVNYLQRVRSGLSAARIILRKQRALRRSLNSLRKLDDRLLEDIGFSRADIIAAESGNIDQAALELRRINNRDTRRINLQGAVRSRPAELRKAANDAVYDRVKCA